MMGECEIVTLKVRGLYSKCENITNLRLKMGGERRAAVVELVTGRMLQKSGQFPDEMEGAQGFRSKSGIGQRCVCLFATGLKKGESRGQTMSRYHSSCS